MKTPIEAGTDTPLDGELGVGADNTLISGIRRRTTTLLQLNDSNNPVALDIGDYYSTGGDGNDLTVYLQTLSDGEVSFPASNASFSRVDQVRFTIPSDAQTLLDNLASGDRLIFKTARPETPDALDASVSLDGGLAGSIAATATLSDAPSVDATVSLTGGLAGSISASATLSTDAAIALTGGLAGSLSAEASLGDAPPPGRFFDLGANPFVSNSDWEGSYLIDPLLVVGGATAYLRRIGESGGGSCRIDISSAASGSYTGAGPELIPAWEVLVNAIVFSADGGGLTLKGPNHPDNSFRDPTEPYFWTPDNSTAYRDWIVAEPRNVTVRFNGPAAPGLIDATVSLDGGLSGSIAATASLGQAPALDIAASLDGGLAGAISATASLGQAPALDASIALDGGLSGSIDAAATLGQAPELDAAIALTGGLAGSISATSTLGALSTVDTSAALTGGLSGSISAAASLDLLLLSAFDATGLTMDWLALFEAPATINATGDLFGRSPRTAFGTLVDGEAGIGVNDANITRIRKDGNLNDQIRFNDNAGFSWSTTFGGDGSLTNQRFYVQTFSGLAVVPLEGNVASAAGNNFLLDIPVADQAIVASIVGGARFIMGFGAPTPIDTSITLDGGLSGSIEGAASLGGEPGPSDATIALEAGLSGSIAATASLSGAPEIDAAVALDGGLAGSISATASLSGAPDLDVSISLDGGLAGTISATATLTALDPIDATVSLDGGLSGSISATADVVATSRFQGLVTRSAEYAITDRSSGLIRVFTTAGGASSTIALHANNTDPIGFGYALINGVGRWLVLDRARKRVYVYSLAGAYVAADSFNLHADITQPTGIVGIAERIWIHSRGTFYSLLRDGTRVDAEDFDAHADNGTGKNIGTDGARLLCLDTTTRKVFGYTTPGASLPLYTWELHVDNDDPTGIGFRDGVYYVLNSGATPKMFAYEIGDTETIGDEDPFPWDDVVSLTFSARDGDGFRRSKMFESPQWEKENLVIGFRRELDTEDDYNQVIFQQSGAITEVGTKDAYEIPVARSPVTAVLSEGTIDDIVPALTTDYSLRFLVPALPLIEEFPSGRGPVWLWGEVSADVASAIEDLDATSPWPETAIAAANEVTPGDNVVGDIVTLYRGSVISTRGWDAVNELWVSVDGFVDGNLFVPGTIQTGALAAQSVTAEKIFVGDGVIAAADGSLTISTDEDGGIVLGPAGIGIQVGNSGLVVNASGIALQVGPDSGLVVGPAGVGIQAADSSLVVNASGIALQSGADSGITVGPNGIAIETANAGLILGPDGLGLGVASGSGLLIGANGLEILTTGTNITVGPNGLSVTVDAGPPGEDGPPGDEGGPGPPGPPGITFTVGDTSLAITGSSIRLNTSPTSGLVVGPSGVSVGDLDADNITTGTLSADRISG